VHGDVYQVSRSLREMVVFAQHNIIRDPPFTNIDFVSCRNLLIYLQPNLQNKVMELFNFSLNPGGILFLGSSETIGQHEHYFDVLQQRWKIYKSKGRKGLNAENCGRLHVLEPIRARVSAPVRKHLAVELEDERMLERFVLSLAGGILPLTLIVNERLELLYTIGDGKDILKMPPGRTQFNIANVMEKELAIPLATSIQRSFSRNENVAYSNLGFKSAGKNRKVGLKVILLGTKKNQEPLAAVLIEDIPDAKLSPEQRKDDDKLCRGRHTAHVRPRAGTPVHQGKSPGPPSRSLKLPTRSFRRQTRSFSPAMRNCRVPMRSFSRSTRNCTP